MKPSLCVGLLAVSLSGSVARAESLPSFHVPSCSYRATHIVVVKTEAGAEGKFQVVESWKGDQRQGSVLKVPALAKDAKGEMVLFLRRDPRAAAGDGWKGASIFDDLRTSVVWLDGEKVTAVEQPINPGPAYITTIPAAETRKELKKVVF